MPAVAGLRTALACAAALRRLPADPARLRSIAAVAAAPGSGDGRWLSEAEAKALLRAHGIAVPDGRVVADADEAVRAAGELGGAVALKASSPTLRHKSDAGALVLGVSGEDAVRAAFARVARAGRAVLVERMAAPASSCSSPRAATPSCRRWSSASAGSGPSCSATSRSCRCRRRPRASRRRCARCAAAGVLTGARGRMPVDLAALAALAAAAGELLLSEPLVLLELNPVIATPDGAIAVDALARRVADCA